jgi:hypothetical protein
LEEAWSTLSNTPSQCKWQILNKFVEYCDQFLIDYCVLGYKMCFVVVNIGSNFEFAIGIYKLKVMNSNETCLA